jgi:ABC-type polysaccharide transport system permease subunit
MAGNVGAADMGVASHRNNAATINGATYWRRLKRVVIFMNPCKKL